MKEQQSNSGPGKVFYHSKIIFIIIIPLHTSWSVLLFLLPSYIAMNWKDSSDFQGAYVHHTMCIMAPNAYKSHGGSLFCTGIKFDAQDSSSFPQELSWTHRSNSIPWETNSNPVHGPQFLC